MGNYTFYHKYYLNHLHTGEVLPYLNSVVIRMRDSSSDFQIKYVFQILCV